MSIIKSLSVGNGDMYYIKHNSDNFTIIDCCLCDDNEADIVQELKRESAGKNIVRFISTHPDDDHIRGLEYLQEQMNILNFTPSGTRPLRRKDAGLRTLGSTVSCATTPRKHFTCLGGVVENG